MTARVCGKREKVEGYVAVDPVVGLFVQGSLRDVTAVFRTTPSTLQPVCRLQRPRIMTAVAGRLKLAYSSKMGANLPRSTR